MVRTSFIGVFVDSLVEAPLPMSRSPMCYCFTNTDKNLMSTPKYE